MTRRFQDALTKATHVASGADQGVEVRVYEETHDSSRRFRCVDGGGVCWGSLRTDDDYDDFHLDNN